jgi:molecular chaperone DnaK
MLKENGEKIQGPEKGEVESVLADSKKLLEGTPSAKELKEQHEKLTQASHKLAEVLYKANAAQAAAATGAAPAEAQSAPDQKKDEGVIDAEYVDVEEKK